MTIRGVRKPGSVMTHQRHARHLPHQPRRRGPSCWPSSTAPLADARHVLPPARPRAWCSPAAARPRPTPPALFPHHFLTALGPAGRRHAFGVAGGRRLAGEACSPAGTVSGPARARWPGRWSRRPAARAGRSDLHYPGRGHCRLLQPAAGLSARRSTRTTTVAPRWRRRRPASAALLGAALTAMLVGPLVPDLAGMSLTPLLRLLLAGADRPAALRAAVAGVGLVVLDRGAANVYPD